MVKGLLNEYNSTVVPH